MEKDNCELLFEYLRSILYDQQIHALDVKELDEPYQKLGKGLAFLQQAVEEMLAYTEDLSRGNLSGAYPSRDNFLCVNLKNLHANLNHLTWQAKQVASGDYSQHVSYLGEFSEAFNTMTAQLKERETQLKEEAQKVQKRAQVIEEYNDLLVEMTRRRKEWIVVVDAQNRDIVYCNKRKDEKRIDPEFCEKCRHRLSFRNDILNWQDSEQYKVWEAGDEEQGYYRITTFHIEWRGQNAYAHIVVDITDEKQAANRLNSKAYMDPGTGIHNRLFFDEYMESVLEEGREVTLCYLDLDLYHYFIGRDDQSVNETVMMSRIDQQLKVTKIIMDSVDLSTVKSRKLERYMERFLSIILAVSSIHLLMIGDSLALKKRRAMWRYLEKKDPALYHRMRLSVGGMTYLPSKFGNQLSLAGYRVAKKIVKFQ